MYDKVRSSMVDDNTLFIIFFTLFSIITMNMDDGERDRTNDKWEDGREERQRHRTASMVMTVAFPLSFPKRYIRTSINPSIYGRRINQIDKWLNSKTLNKSSDYDIRRKREERKVKLFQHRWRPFFGPKSHRQLAWSVWQTHTHTHTHIHFHIKLTSQNKNKTKNLKIISIHKRTKYTQTNKPTNQHCFPTFCFVYIFFYRKKNWKDYFKKRFVVIV